MPNDIYTNIPSSIYHPSSKTSCAKLGPNASQAVALGVSNLEDMVRSDMVGAVEQLDNLLIKTARMRGVLFGEGEQGGDGEAISSGGGLCNEMRYQLDKINSRIEHLGIQLNRCLNVLESRVDNLDSSPSRNG